MVVKTTREIKGIVYDYTYSDAGMMIERDGARYSEAYDPIGMGRVYTETDEMITNEELFITGDEFMAKVEEVL